MKTSARTWLLAGIAAISLGLLGACGDDDDGGGGGGDLETYCDLSRELDEQEDFASDAQLDEILDAAPDEIREDAELVVEAFKDADEENLEEVFEDEDVVSALERIEAFEAENCPTDGG